MNRRTALRHCIIMAAGTAILPACRMHNGQAKQPLTNLHLTASHEALVAALTETIIPTTNTPGANDLQVHAFVLTMVDDCYSPEEQLAFVKGMDEFEAAAKSRLGKPFAELQAGQRQQLLSYMEQADNNAGAFYQTVKSLTIQGYTTSQMYMTQVRVYEMIPGRFRGCVPVKTTKA